MFFDTHCHLNFEAFDGRVDNVINEAKKVGVEKIVIPGTDIPTSKAAIEIAEKYKGIYAAVGIHPHHVFELFKARERNFYAPAGIQSDLIQIERLLQNPRVVAIGEIWIYRHYYKKKKHQDYKVDEEFVELQNIFFL